MNASLSPARTFFESVPLAIVVGLWTLISLVDADGTVGLALRLAGVALALAYVVVRSRALAAGDQQASSPTPGTKLALANEVVRSRTTDAADDQQPVSPIPGAVAATNATPVLAAAPWFLAALLVSVPLDLLYVALFDPRTDPMIEPFRFWFAATGFLTVALYAAVVRTDRLARRANDDAGGADDGRGADATAGDD